MTAARNGNELFERGVAARPDEPGLFFFDAAISFRAAAERAWALAAALRELGLRPGDRLALMLQNDPATVVAIHAAWHLGAIVTAINPMSKAEEVRRQLTDSGARLVICLESLHAVVAAAAAGTAVETIVTVAEPTGPAGPESSPARPESSLAGPESSPAWPEPSLAGPESSPARPEPMPLAPTAAPRPPRPARPGAIDFESLCAGRAEPRPAAVAADSPALLAYTSGTTGTPKGAIVTHRAVVHNGETMRAWADLGAGDVTVAMAPLFHITGLICHLAAARAGATPLLLLHRFEPGEFLRLVERRRGTYVIGPLTAFIALLDHPDFERRDLSSLTKVASGGAPVYPAIVARWERATGTYIHNTYGLTETAAPSHLVPRGERAPVDPGSGALSIGKPIADTESKIVLVEEGTDAASGEIGEIATRGPAVTPGYWGRPEETAHALRHGWLHTGDVGRRDAAGWFFIVDRIKDMIVAGGYKVWPRDVEDALYAHPAVGEAAVVGAPDPYRGETVVAHVVLRPGATASAAELIAHCRERLAVYKAPHVVHLVDALPKTASGKVLRRDLRRAAAGADGPEAAAGARPGGPAPAPRPTSPS